MKTLNVKVLDMTDGRVEKIKYSGDIYRLIPDSYPSVYGDICLNKKATIGDWKIGMYFENTAENSGDYHLPQGGDKGVYMDDEANLNRESCDVFRKESEFKVGDVVFKPFNNQFYKIDKVIKDRKVMTTTTGKVIHMDYTRLATHNERVKFEKDNKPEYIEVSPVVAYEIYFFDRQDVYCNEPEDYDYYHVGSKDFMPSSIKKFNTKFYIKKEN